MNLKSNFAGMQNIAISAEVGLKNFDKSAHYG